MSTPVEDIYVLFLSQIGKDTICELEQEIAEDLMSTYLQGAIVEFDICKKDLTIVENAIVDDLDNDEKFILANGMVLYWLQPKKLTQEVIKNRLTDGDYAMKSPGNLLDKLMKLETQTENKLRRRMKKYSWKNMRINQ